MSSLCLNSHRAAPVIAPPPVRAIVGPERSVRMRPRGIAIIPAATMPRGRWLDRTCAGALQRIANRPILVHVLDWLLEAGVGELAVLAPTELRQHAARCLKREGPQGPVRLLRFDPSEDPAVALGALADFAGGLPAVVHRADGMLGGSLPELSGAGRPSAPQATLFVAHDVRNEQRLPPVVRRALHLAEIDPAAGALGLAGVCVLAGGALDRVARTPGVLGGMEPADLAQALAAGAEARMEVRVVNEWRAYSGDPRDLLHLNRIALDRIGMSVPPDKRRQNRVEGHVMIDPSASVSASVISGPAVIGAGAVVLDSYVGPHTSIGERARLEGAEIEQSIVFAGASILHVGGRLVNSVVGRNAKVFRDFSVPRAMRLQIGDGDRVALC